MLSLQTHCLPIDKSLLGPALSEAVGFRMSFQEAIESKLITDYRLWLPDAATIEAWQGSCCIEMSLCILTLLLSIYTQGLLTRICLVLAGPSR